MAFNETSQGDNDNFWLLVAMVSYFTKYSTKIK